MTANKIDHINTFFDFNENENFFFLNIEKVLAVIENNKRLDK